MECLVSWSWFWWFVEFIVLVHVGSLFDSRVLYSLETILLVLEHSSLSTIAPQAGVVLSNRLPGLFN